jgi:hypothetical protein
MEQRPFAKFQNGTRGARFDALNPTSPFQVLDEHVT